uniref:uncharacterized protein LOC123453546 n=1 Tax=Jaculus jaculus TaxID=51337 RepID=UPI001E1B3EF0|nr:uncharacterized protein LOC123453546 [Jaculus jaculus]
MVLILTMACILMVVCIFLMVTILLMIWTLLMVPMLRMTLILLLFLLAYLILLFLWILMFLPLLLLLLLLLMLPLLLMWLTVRMENKLYKRSKKERACPLEKGNKSEVTKSQLRELVRTPAPETSTAEMDALMEISGYSTSDSTIRMENQCKVFPYRSLMEVSNSENDVTVIEIEEMVKPKVFLQENPKLGTTHKKYIISEGSALEMDSVSQVGGSPMPGNQHHTGRSISLELFTRHTFSVAMSGEGYHVYNAAYAVAYCLHDLLLQQVDIPHMPIDNRPQSDCGKLNHLLKNMKFATLVGDLMNMNQRGKSDPEYDIFNLWDFQESFQQDISVSYDPSLWTHQKQDVAI